MAYEQKEGTVTIFTNKHKTNDKAPSHVGTAKIDGRELDISLWVRETKTTPPKKYFSGTIKPKRVSEPSAPDQPPSDEEIKF